MTRDDSQLVRVAEWGDSDREHSIETFVTDRVVEPQDGALQEPGPSDGDGVSVALPAGIDHLRRAVDADETARGQSFEHASRGDAVSAADLEHVMHPFELQLVDDPVDASGVNDHRSVGNPTRVAAATSVIRRSNGRRTRPLCYERVMTERGTGDAAFDAAALREKYRYERDKRVRVDGNDQYQEMAGTFAHFLDDPYVEPVTREPLFDEVDVVVIGGGFGGLLAGARLRQAGVAGDRPGGIRIVEKGGDFGGTWYWNRYPGAMCDVEAYIYLPLLEELNYIPKQKYTEAPEILAHSRAIGEHFDLYRDACFQTEVTELRWDADAARWIVSTNRGDAMRARFVVMASGPLHRPKLPGIAGIESFAGHSFHTSRWDYGYTGGGPEGGLTGLAGKRVGIIGTGATAVQAVPHVGAAAEQLYVFQRTPSSIDVRGSKP